MRSPLGLSDFGEGGPVLESGGQSWVTLQEAGRSSIELSLAYQGTVR